MKPWKVGLTRGETQWFITVSIFRDDELYQKDVVYWTAEKDEATKVAKMVDELISVIGKAWINKFIGI